jgi:hypothetical protein
LRHVTQRRRILHESIERDRVKSGLGGITAWWIATSDVPSMRVLFLRAPWKSLMAWIHRTACVSLFRFNFTVLLTQEKVV